MNANAVPLLGIFETKLRLEVPLFQRQYVWTRELQWEPLWEDISRKFADQIEGRLDSPVHFLGAMVLDQKMTPITHVEKRQVIDGQQRLTTFQIFITALRDFCKSHACADIADELHTYVTNKGMMANPQVEKFKVWPTQADRAQFMDVISSGSRAELENRHPVVKKKYARYPDPRPPMVEAYLYFVDQIGDFFLGDDTDPPLGAEKLLAERMELAFTALKGLLKVVVIDLDGEDDAQVIFETLNARGAPLLPADLLRNFIFLRAAKQGETPETLYEQYWSKFDLPFWREEVKQGRLLRPRSDLYIQHYLSSKKTVDIPIKHLFVEYKDWISKEKPFATVKDELASLSRQGDNFRRIIEPQKSDVIYRLVTFLDRYDIRTAYPLLLHLLDQNLPDGEWELISRTLESYLLRRAVCGLTTKNYNRVFLGLTRTLLKDGTSADRISRALSEAKGDSTEWPRDEAFRASWSSSPLYQLMQSARIVHIFRRLNDVCFNPQAEEIPIESPLTLEHLMPQEWTQYWPLSDGSKGISQVELEDADPNDSIAIASRLRHGAIHTLGNLTIISQPLNSSISNSAWETKKTAILSSSLLPLNQHIATRQKWDEDEIGVRSKLLFDKALEIWPAPIAITAAAEIAAGVFVAPQLT